MGQYFTPTFLDAAGRIVAALNPDDYGSGLKIYGHTRHDAPLMRAVEALLRLDGNIRLVWAGDYADEERGRNANLYFLAEPKHFVRFAGLVLDDVAPTATLPDHFTAGGGVGFICNADKRAFLDIAALPLDDWAVRRNPSVVVLRRAEFEATVAAELVRALMAARVSDSAVAKVSGSPALKN